MSHSGMVRIAAVEPLRAFVVRLTFTDGLVADVDLEPHMWGEVFEPHRRDREFFRGVYVDEISGTIAWPNETDLDPDVLYALATGTYDELMRGETAAS
ncbi:MAG: DUF2442 domain-containing protein [Actinomycetota bacterium]|nr:DUF2442 domain-containing protein [Actinomycetota bacterium]